jgi:histidine triad (HIT) family protein
MTEDKPEAALDVDPTECPFCSIARGEDCQAEIICQAEHWVAFFPLEPATPGHTLVIPRLHVANLWAVDDVLQAPLMGAVIRVGRAIDTALRPEGMNLITSDGRAAEQTVGHLHLHLVPRWQRDGFGKIWPPGQRYEDEALEDVAERVRMECSSLGT